MPPEHVEMPGPAVVGNEMHPWLENRLPAAVRRDHVGYRIDDLRAADAEALNVGPGQKPQPDLIRAHPLIIFGGHRLVRGGAAARGYPGAMTTTRPRASAGCARGSGLLRVSAEGPG